MTDDPLSRHVVVIERRLKEAMEKLAAHHPQIAGRLRTVWRREDDAWARGEELSPGDDPYYAAGPEPEPEPYYPRPTAWERFRGFWQKP